MMVRRPNAKGAFTLLEVVIAMGMLAMIAVPAVGLATMAAKKTRANLTAGTASELKNRVEAAIRSEEPFSDGLVGATFYASSDLRYIERSEEIGSLRDGNDGYFKLSLSEPVDYDYDPNDSYRLYVCRMVWPSTPAPGEDSQDMVTLLAFRK